MRRDRSSLPARRSGPAAPLSRPTGRSVEERAARRRSRRLTAVTIGILVPLSAILPAGAQSGASDPRTRREEIRREKATIAAQLNELTATDQELEQAYATLSANVRAQEARVADANRQADEAQRHAERLQAEADDAQRQVDQLKAKVRDRAVASYMRPSGAVDVSEVLFTNGDVNEGELRKAIADQLTSQDKDAVDQFRAAKAAAERQRKAAEAAGAEAQARRDEAAGELAKLQADQQALGKVKQELENRIANYQAHAGQLDAESASIEAIIRQQELAAQAEAQRQAQARAAATAGTAGTAGTGGSGGSGNSGSSTNGGSVPTTRPPSPPPSPGGFGWPCGGPINSPFGTRWGRMHTGVDIGCASGAPVVSSKAGTVIFVGNNGGYGNLVLVDHGGGIVTAYAHLSSFATSVGASVGGGTLLGTVGCTGSCTGPHLHFEVRVNGSAVDPMGYL